MISNNDIPMHMSMIYQCICH